MAKDKKALIHTLATKYNLSLQEVERAVNHQLKFVAKVMAEGKFEAVRLPYFGKFSAKKGRIKHIQKLSDGTTG